MNFDRLAELFDRAAQLSSPAEVAAFLAKACPDDPALRRQVENLLEARTRAEGFLEATVQAPPPPGPWEQIGDRIGHYKLLQKLGEGGCGVVYMAEQREPVHRRVALKVIKPGMDTQAVVARFEAEREALARMEHPNIAKVFDAGVTRAGRPYFVMELVRGTRITEYCDSQRLSIPARLELFAKVCHAIQHAHQKGVIHRDIKPANVLVTVHDGRPEPKVIDFGIAKAVEGRLTDRTVFTAYEQFLGTPAYMSPEQATLSSGDIDTRSDIYSLGVLLYELITGHTPFDTRELLALGLEAMLRTIREQEPAKPSTRIRQSEVHAPPARGLAPAARMPLPSDLDWIVMRCLDKDRTRRYETANSLALDIQRHLASEPILARPPSAHYRLQKAFQRNRVPFLAGILVLTSLVTGLTVSLSQARIALKESLRASQAERAAAQQARDALSERNRALAAEAEADRNARTARRFAYAAQLHVATRAWLDGNTARLTELLEAQIPRPGEADLRGFEWRYLWGQSRNESLVRRRVARVPAYGAFFSPDGSRVFATHLYDALRVLDARSLEIESVLTTNAFDLTLSADGSTLGTVSYDGRIHLFDTRSLVRRTLSVELSPEFDLVLLSQDGTRLDVIDDHQISSWDSTSGRPLGVLPIRPRSLSTSAFAASPDGSLFVTADDRSILLWDRLSHDLVAELPGHPGGTYSARFSPNGRWLATGGWRDRVLRLWDVPTKTCVAALTNHTGWIARMAFSPDSSRLATASADHTIRIWDVQSLAEIATLRGFADEVWTVSYSFDGAMLVAADRSGVISLWNARPPTKPPTVLSGTFADGAFDPERRTFTTVTAGGLVQTWDEPSLREIRRSSVALEQATVLRLAPGAGHLAVGQSNGLVRVHDLSGTRPVRTLTHPGDRPVTDLQLLVDASRLVSVSPESFRVWDPATGKVLFTRTNRADSYWRLTPVALSPDGSRVAFGSADLQLHLVDVTTHQERIFPPDLWGVQSLEFSADGLLLGAIGRDHRIRVWQTADLRDSKLLKSWRQSPNAFAFHPGGGRLAVASEEGGILWFDVQGNQELGAFPSDASPRRLQFSPSGDVLSVQLGGRFQFWRAPSWTQTDAQGSSSGRKSASPGP